MSEALRVLDALLAPDAEESERTQREKVARSERLQSQAFLDWLASLNERQVRSLIARDKLTPDEVRTRHSLREARLHRVYVRPFGGGAMSYSDMVRGSAPDTRQAEADHRYAQHLGRR